MRRGKGDSHKSVTLRDDFALYPARSIRNLTTKGEQMLDGIMRKQLDPLLNAWGIKLAAIGFRANHIT